MFMKIILIYYEYSPALCKTATLNTNRNIHMNVH